MSVTECPTITAARRLAKEKGLSTNGLNWNMLCCGNQKKCDYSAGQEMDAIEVVETVRIDPQDIVAEVDLEVAEKLHILAVRNGGGNSLSLNRFYKKLETRIANMDHRTQ